MLLKILKLSKEDKSVTLAEMKQSFNIRNTGLKKRKMKMVKLELI